MESPEIKAIQQRYRASLAEKAEMLSSHLARVNAKDVVLASAYTDLHEDLHKLAGSSGMYGYDDIALAARDLMANIHQQEFSHVVTKLVALRGLLQQYA